MAADVERDGYTAELTEDDLEIVYRGPRGRQLKKCPAQLAGAPGMAELSAVRRTLTAHRAACEEQALVWAKEGAHAPRALAEADPEWERALTAAGVPLTGEPGEDGLFARTYAGPHGRTLTQLLAEDVVPYRDMLMREDAWEPAGLFATGLPDPAPDADGRLPFPERVLAAHPHQQGLALEKIRALERESAGWRYVFKKDMDDVLAGLESTAPALAVTLLDEMADFALGTGDLAEAAAWFGRARKAERNAGRTPDHTWLYTRCLRYARAGALSATVLRAWASELATWDGVAARDLDRFRTVVLARSQGPEDGRGDAHSGIHPQLATDIRKLAKAAGLDADEELATMMEGLLAQGGISLSDTRFWAQCCKGRALDLLVERCPGTVRTAVLALRPRGYDSGGEAELWQTLLTRTGTLAQLRGELPGLPHGAAAAWLTDCVNAPPPRNQGPWPVLYELAGQIAPHLAAEGVPVEFRQWEHRHWKSKQRVPLDLIDVLLEHGVEVDAPPERLADTAPYDLLVSRCPELRHLLAHEGFQREVRAWMRADLDMTVGDGTAADGMSSNRWYNPHETKGWSGVHHLYATWVGHEELHAWCARERERLRSGLDFDGFVLLLGRFVHVGGAVDALLKDAEAAREVAAVDVVGLLMSELPVRLDRERVEQTIAKVEPSYVSRRDGVTGKNYTLLRAELPEFAHGTTWPEAGETFHRLAYLLVMAANCLDGQARLVRRFTPATPGAPAQEPPASWRTLALRLTEPATGDTPPWDGDPEQGGGEPDDAWRGLRIVHFHGHAEAEALRIAGGLLGNPGKGAAELAEYAACPYATPAGEWRIVEYDASSTTPRSRWARWYTRPIRTATSAALLLSERTPGAAYRQDVPLRVLEYAPGGAFPDEGPLAAAGLRPARTQVLAAARPGSWYTRFAALIDRHGPVPARPERAADLAARTGLSVAEATLVLRGCLPSAPHQDLGHNLPGHAGRYGRDKWKVRDKEIERAGDGLHFLTPAHLRTLYGKLLPDDPERLWTEGQDVDRAVEWWRAEFGEPLPVPHELTPLAAREIAAPEGEHARRKEHTGEERSYRWPHQEKHSSWWPALRRPALLGRLALGDGCLGPDTPQAPHPGLLGLPRIAAWAAYRSPAGAPLRAAAGAAVARLRAELAAGPGPLRVFSLQSNYLMGAPPSTAPLTAHPAVTVTDDETYAMRHVRVDPAQLAGPDDPVLRALDDYLEGLYPSQWLPAPSGLPALADLRLLLSEDFAALGAHLEADRYLPAGWEQHPARSVPQLVERCARHHGLGEDAAALYLMLLALPDPTDRWVKEWTGWKPARFKAATAELAATPLVVRASRARAGRALFVPGPWQERPAPNLPLEAAKLALLPPLGSRRAAGHLAAVPAVPVPVLFERAWERAVPPAAC
ncbi:hypothetical protein ABZ569_23085 [Streptomyces albus]|uniref:hypothetical protein n=1 Tax=Streptomyces albus TaxID=1888 RepID=UPI0033E1A87E